MKKYLVWNNEDNAFEESDDGLSFDLNNRIFNEGYYHRLDGPAFIFVDGDDQRYWANNEEKTYYAYKLIKELGISLNHNDWSEIDRDMFCLHFTAMVIKEG